MPAHILFVGRQPDIYAPLWRQLLLSNTQVSFAASQPRALRELATAAVDVIVLDAASLRLSPEPLARTLRQGAPAARIVLIADSDVAVGYSYDYLLPSLVLGRKELYTIPIATRAFYGTYNTDMGLIMAALLLAMLPILILYLFLQRFIVEGVVAGAVKG